MTRATQLRSKFRTLHTDPPAAPTPGILVMPNPWDVGSAKLLAHCGAAALATTSAGHAASNGRLDQHITLDEVVAHATLMSAATDLPLNIDSEDCFADSPHGVSETAEQLAATDAAGFSIEDYDPRADGIRPIGVAAERVAAAKAGGADLVLTARAENLLYGAGDLDDTIARLIAYRDAGADVLYAPGLRTEADIERVVNEAGIPVNVLALPGTPPIPRLAELGVARISVGSLFSNAAYGALVAAAREVLGPGTTDYAAVLLDNATASAAFS